MKSYMVDYIVIVSKCDYRKLSLCNTRFGGLFIYHMVYYTCSIFYEEIAM